MELLIPGLILVALMVWASTKIKKRAAEAFEPELIETEAFSIHKPEGFLHVLNDDDHDFEAYSKEFAEEDFRIRRGKIEVDLLRNTALDSAAESIRESSGHFELISETGNIRRLETEETANEIPFKVFYKLVASGQDTYRLRFAALSRYTEDYLHRIEETLDSFKVNAH